MTQLTKSHTIDMDLVVSWLRSEIATLNYVLETIIRDDNYNDDYVKESIKKAEISIRQIRKFINSPTNGGVIERS